MLDRALRPRKDRLLAPLLRTPLGRVHPHALTGSALVLTLGAAVAAWQGLTALAVAGWLAGRLADGMDGLVARHRGRATDGGGLLDIVLDTVGYAAVPIGVAAGDGTTAAWVATSVLLAAFYVNTVSWTYLAALEVKREAGSTGSTSAPMPAGLVEGTETIVFFTVALAVPSIAIGVWWVMAAATALTAAERTIRATRSLR
jgi:phosphatidylglycerophosphate synthase